MELVKLLLILGVAVAALAAPDGSEVGVEVCRYHKFGTILQNPVDCNKFFLCQHDKPIMMSCPMGLFFDNDRQTCDWISEVTCPDNLRLRVQKSRQQ